MTPESKILSVGAPTARAAPYRTLEAWRGLASLWVVLYHSAHAAAVNALRRPGGFGRFVRARARRIYPPYWFAWVIAAAFSVLAGALARHLGPSHSTDSDVLHQPVWHHLCNLTLTQVAAHVPSLLGQSWTLCYEIAFYFLVGLVFLIPRLGAGSAGC